MPRQCAPQAARRSTYDRHATLAGHRHRRFRRAGRAARLPAPALQPRRLRLGLGDDPDRRRPRRRPGRRRFSPAATTATSTRARSPCSTSPAPSTRPTSPAPSSSSPRSTIPRSAPAPAPRPSTAATSTAASPGRPDGTVTEKIADYVTRHLLPMADIVLDFHSGGRTLDFLPFCRRPRPPRQGAGGARLRRRRGLRRPVLDAHARDRRRRHVRHHGRGDGQDLRHHRARRRRHRHAPTPSRIAQRGVINVLRHAGIVEGQPELSATRWLDMPSQDCFCFSEDGGLFEPLFDLSDAVEKGEVVAQNSSDGAVSARRRPKSAPACRVLSWRVTILALRRQVIAQW